MPTVQKSVVIWPNAIGPSHLHPVTAFAISFDSKWVASGCKDGRITLWEAKNPSNYADCPGSNKPICALAFSPNGDRLAFARGRGCISVLKIEHTPGTKQCSIKPLQNETLPHENCTVHAMAWSRPSKMVLCCNDGVMRVVFPPRKPGWYSSTAHPFQFAYIRPSTLTFAVFSHDASLLAFSDERGYCYIWDVVCDKLLDTLGPPPSTEKPQILHAQFDEKGEHIVTCHEDGTLCVLDLLANEDTKAVTAKNLRMTKNQHNIDPLWATFLPGSGNVLAVGLVTSDNNVGPVHYLDGRVSTVVAPNGEFIVSALSQGAVCLWTREDVTRNVPLNALERPTYPGICIAIY